MNGPGAAVDPEFLKGENRVLELMARGAPLRQVMDLLLELIQAQCPGMLCSILLLDPDGLHLRHCSAPDLPPEYTRAIDGEPIGPKAGSCGTAIFRREQVIVEDIRTDPLWDHYRALALRFDLRACWSTPIFDSEHRVLGTFAMYFRTPGRPEQSHLQLIGVSTYIAAIAIARRQAEQENIRREAQLVEAQQIASLGSYEWDVRANQVRRSDQLCRIFGVAPHEFEPTYEGYLNRVHPDDRATTKATIDAAFRDRQPFDFEERIVRPDGTIRFLRSQGQWTLDESGDPLKLVGICQDITERKQVEGQLHALSARLINAQEEERARLARELHDDLSQEIAVLSVAASNLKRHMDESDSAAQEQSDRIQERLLRVAEKIRLLSHNLHPAMLEYSGLEAALKKYCSDFTTLTGMTVAFQAHGSFEHLPKPVAMCVYRVAQEALQNVSKHAHVDQAQVALTRDAECLRLTVSDQGTGIDSLAAVSPGLGLVSMKERARMVGGAVNIETSPHRGTTLTLRIPLQ
jgi:PAS domain S-box-containing protein